jgi:hypothetical protein
MSKAIESKLDTFRDRLDEWFGQEHLPLADAQARLKELGCAVSLSRLSRWWQMRSAELDQDRLLAQIATGAAQCQALKKEFGTNAPPEMDTLISLLRVLILQFSTQASANPELVNMIGGLLRPVLVWAKLQDKAKDRELVERRVKLLEEQAAKARAAISDPTLTAEQQRERLREILK